MKVAALFCVFIALAVAQTALPLTGLMTGVFTEQNDPYAVHVYVMQLNESMATIDLEVTGLNTCYFYVYVSGREAPCGNQWDVPSNQIYPCRGNSNARDSFYGSTETFTVFPSSVSEDMFVSLASSLYITVTRDSVNDDEYCNYTIAPVVTACPSGQVAVGGDDTDCVALTNLGTNATSIISPRNGANGWSFYRLTIPAMAASVQVWGNVTNDVSFYISQRRVPYYSGSYYDVYFDGSYNSESDMYEYDGWLYNPEQGYLYIGVYGAIDEGNFTVTVRTCSGSVGGWNCSYPVYTVNSPSTTVNEMFNVTNTAEDRPCVYYVLSVAPGDVTSYVNYTVSHIAGDFYAFYRKGGYVEDLDYNYVNTAYRYNVYSSQKSVTFTLTPADLVFGGNFVIGVQNYDNGVGDNFVGTITSSSMSSSSTSTSGGASTTESASTTGDSAASSVAYCFALIALCLATLF